MSLFTETVTLLSRQELPQRDAYGNDTYVWVQADTPAWLEMRQGEENTSARESSSSNMWAYLPLETLLPVKAVSKAVWNGVEWDIDGDPAVQPGGFIVEGYQRVGLKRSTG